MSASPASRALAHRLYAEHQPWLLERLRVRLRHREDAEDLAAETFVQAIARPDLDAVREPRAFLATIAKRILFHFWRRRDLEQAYLDALAQLPAALAPSVEERALLVEALLHVEQALEGLPPVARAAFLYSQLDGLTYREIAARLGISSMSVRRYVTRAIERCVAVLA